MLLICNLSFFLFFVILVAFARDDRHECGILDLWEAVWEPARKAVCLRTGVSQSRNSIHSFWFMPITRAICR